MGLENNKAAHHIAVCADHNTRITHIGWASCRITPNQATGFSSHVKDNIVNELAASSDERNLPPNLPRELTFLEVDTALPKISPLPTGSAGAEYVDVFFFCLLPSVDLLTSFPPCDCML